jgi:xanthine/CO dehydrogenase XdhC/CoxF family maturation factor
MKEIEDIIRAFDKATAEGKQTALATVVYVEGSAYRRPGARMLVTEDGQLTGAISGGCLEGDALRKALLVMAQQRAVLVTYDTTDEDDAKLGVGLGCNGIIKILIEPIDPGLSANPVQLLKQVIAKRQKSVLATLFSLENQKGFQPGTCLLQLESGEIYSSNINIELQTNLLKYVEDAAVNQASSIKNIRADETQFTAFIEFIKPAISLVIVGAGNDAIPLAQTANILGWHTTIIDGRPNYATTQRFPLAQQVKVCKPEKALEEMVIDDQTVFVLMTHNYNYDLALLRQLINSNTPYIGSLGPKKKIERMLDELHEEGIYVNNDQLAKLYGPVGLDIGAETAEEIALSIMSEIKAVLSNRDGQSLRDRPETIHVRSSVNMP